MFLCGKSDHGATSCSLKKVSNQTDKSKAIGQQRSSNFGRSHNLLTSKLIFQFYADFDYINPGLEKIVTPADEKQLKRLLQHCEYDEKEMSFLINGFESGFKIGYKGPRMIRRESPNLSFDCGSQEDLWEKLMKETRMNGYAGPFENPLFDNYIQSPIGLVLKSNGDTRLIFHRSYP